MAKLLQAQADVGLVSVYLQMDEQLNGWDEKLGSAERLLIGNNEFEVSRLDGYLLLIQCYWRRGLTLN